MNILVTGCNGFVGNHLIDTIVSSGHNAYGVGRDEKPSGSKLAGYMCANLIEEFPEFTNVEFDTIIHLAGLSAVGPSFDNPQVYITANSSMVTTVCEYSLKLNKKPRIILVSSGAVYSGEQAMPITENSELGYTSPYAVSKVLNENQAAYYRQRGLDCIVVRPFNHIGPGQNTGFIVPDLYKKILSAPTSGTIKVGNLKTRRDYTDVRDVATAYIKLAEAESLSESTYNVCSRKSLSGEEILQHLQMITGRDDLNIEVDPSLIRPSDIDEIVGANERLQNEVEWSPSYSITTTLQDFVGAA